MSIARRLARSIAHGALPLALACVALGGCSKKSEGTAAPPGAMDAGREPASIDAYERALVDEERRLQAAGVDLRAPAGSPALGGGDMSQDAGAAEAAAEEASPEPEPPARPSRRETRGDRRNCAEVCGLAASICDLEAQICGLASRHPGEPRYHQVCSRAGDDCRSARGACDGC